MRKIITLIVVIIILVTGCTDISNRNLTDDQPTELFTDSSITTTTIAKIIEDFPVDEGETYITYPFSEEDEKFLSEMVFVGANLCIGLSNYGIIPSERIISSEDAVLSDLAELKLNYQGGNVDVVSALVNLNPKNIVMTFGTNYDGIQDAESYVSVYIELIKLIQSYCPNSKIVIVSVPPVNSDSIFQDNQVITEFNTLLKQKVEEQKAEELCFLDIGSELRNNNGELKTNYSSGDKFLLTELGYHAFLWQLCNYTFWESA